MPDMLVLSRDKCSGAVRMMMEIDASPKPLWTPRTMPAPGIHRTVEVSDQVNVAWARDAILDYVAECDDIDPESVMWTSLAEDLEEYIRAA